MNKLLDALLVGAVILASLGYAATSLGPQAMRRRILGALAGIARHAPRFLRLGGVARRLGDRSEKAGGCGGCEDCGTTPPTDRASASEVRIPAASIGKRR